MADKGKSLVIVESPGKVKTISKVLGSEYVVKASVGHVRDLPEKKQDFNEPGLVMGVKKDFTPVYLPLAKKKKVIDDLKKAAKGAERIFLCPDPDREGEAIAWHLAEVLKLPAERTFRVTFDEITPRAIKAAFLAPRKIDMNLVNAQQARRVLDRIVGYKLSPLLSAKLGGWLTAGRVQSVALRLIVEREREIEGFKASEYWTLSARFETGGRTFDAELRALDGLVVVSSADDLLKFRDQDKRLSASGVLRTHIGSAKQALDLATNVRNADYFEVSHYDVKEVQERPYPPFATSQLQQAAANRLGFDARRTMNVAQGLYQGVEIPGRGPVALITYMRTDSFRIAPDALTDCRSYIGERYGAEYLPEKPNAYVSRKGAQEAHECIRPTDVTLAPDEIRGSLSEEQYKLYKLIWQRFVACQIKPAIFDQTTCDIATRGEKTQRATFRATGRVLKFAGWLAVYGAEADTAMHLGASAADRERGDETGEEAESGEANAPAESPKEGAGPAKAKKKGAQILPKLQKGDRPDLKGLTAEQHFTTPPARYTEASIVKTLEREGIGRPSTYATIISTIQDRGYVEKTDFSLQGPRPTPGVAIRSGSFEGVVSAVYPATFGVNAGDGTEAIVPKGPNVSISENGGGFKALIQVRNPAGRRVFMPTALGLNVSDRLVQCFEHSIMDMGFTRKMEGELDKIEEAEMNWKKVLEEFYGPFAQDVTKASTKMTSTKGKGEPSDVKCPACGAPMEKCFNRFGYYLRCTKGPECKTTLRLDSQGNIQEKEKPQATGLTCDLCGSPVFKSTGRFGPYLHCEKYPEKKCTFTMKLNKAGQPIRKFKAIPTDKTCERCKSALVVRVAARGKARKPKAFLSCSNFPKCRAAMDLPPEMGAVGETALKQWHELDVLNKRDLEVYQVTLAQAAT